MRNIKIGGIEIPLRAAHELTQNYSPVQAVSRTRMMDGALKQQTAWNSKLLTTISGSGLIPAGIQTLDFTGPIIIESVAERAITSLLNVISVPSSRRADYGVEGRALLSGKWQATPVSLSVDIATLTPVSGATQYQAIYWPSLICFCDPPTETREARTADYTWQIEAEEI